MGAIPRGSIVRPRILRASALRSAGRKTPIDLPSDARQAYPPNVFAGAWATPAGIPRPPIPMRR